MERQQKQPQRRRSASELRTSEPATTKPEQPEEWLHEELEAVGELKRGAIAAQFPEEFSVDSDFLNGASNVWLPARLHPEIAPGEFQEWLKKHGSQLSKMEDTVNRRKSILSYSYDQGSDDEAPAGAYGRQVAIGVRRRNTTGLVRRKTFIERATEEEEEAVRAGEEAAPFLVQNVQRSSLKRSKLANKRRDSTASTGSARRGRRGRTRSQQQHQQPAAPAVSSPLAPAMPDEDMHAGPADRPAAADDKRMSTAEILKQVTAAVDDFGFDDFDLSGFEASGDDEAPKPQIPPVARTQTAPAAAAKPEKQQRPSPAALERKTVTHKKSSGSWWQWGRDDASEHGARAETPPPMPHGPPAAANNAPGDAGSQKTKLPSPIAFLRFNRKSKKDRKAPGDHGRSQQQQQQQQKQQPSAVPARSAQKSAAHMQPANSAADDDTDSDSSSGTESTPSLQPASQPKQPLSALRPGPSSDAGHSKIPSIITPVRPPPTRSTAGGNRLPIHIERAIYRLASIKLANPRRPLLQQVLLSNMMFWYLELINPKSQQQPHQTSPPSPPSQQQQQQQMMQEPSSQQQQQQQRSPQLYSQPPPQQQQQQQQQQHQQQQHQQQQLGMRSGSPVPYQQPPQPQPQPQQQQPQQHADRRGKRGNPMHKGSRDHNRRRSSNSNGGEQVVMRSPQYERQQQQIYMGNGSVYSQQSPPTSPQSMQFQQQQPRMYQNAAGARSQPAVSNLSQSDEDDDVPLALYRGERNAMSIG
ncbi:hypothetical protein H4R23_001212 [Coemansia sp. Cherry 401B]|nr:hypothetical protein IWW52_001686 [Coemansia sp. RSA 2704]KAJ2738346.1 hypothetical protein H4R23_001212 [Coemansia sp. Cherry 401B]